MNFTLTTFGCGCLNRINFCPKCGSRDVFFASGLPQLWSLWEFRNCGYRGALILEDVSLAEKLRKEWNEKKEASREAEENKNVAKK